MKNSIFFLMISIFFFVSPNIWAQKEKRELSVSAAYQRDMLNIGIDEWNQYFLSLKSDGSEYVWIPKIRLVNRFKEFDLAGQLSIYKKFKNNDYVLVEMGISEGHIAAKSQMRFVYYYTKELWEVNAGFQYINFPSNLFFYGPQIGLSRFIGDFLGSFNLHYIWDIESERPSNYSLQHNWRYYLQDKKSHLSLFASYGFDNSLVIISEQFNNPINKPHLWSIGTYFQSKFYGRTAFRLEYTFTRYKFEFFESNQNSIHLSLEFKRNKKGK